tara:strand:+ start:60 stop:671 length:612 start_codon:yes stop_codon:yes gene_type:complete
MISNIIKDDIDKLKIVSEKVTLEEGEKISSQLFNELTAEGNGIGLAANQIGINKRVCVINVKQPIALVNPVIIEKSEDKFIFPESCLSFPKKHIRTERYVSVKVKADNHKGILSFSADSKDVNDAFECVCVQHEIDHLDGITMFDREFKNEPIVNGVNAPKKIGRNEKVTITDGTETKVIKYKKAKSLIDSGGWKLSDIQINV